MGIGKFFSGRRMKWIGGGTVAATFAGLVGTQQDLKSDLEAAAGSWENFSLNATSSYRQCLVDEASHPAAIGNILSHTGNAFRSIPHHIYSVLPELQEQGFSLGGTKIAERLVAMGAINADRYKELTAAYEKACEDFTVLSQAKSGFKQAKEWYMNYKFLNDVFQLIITLGPLLILVENDDKQDIRPPSAYAGRTGAPESDLTPKVA